MVLGSNNAVKLLSYTPGPSVGATSKLISSKEDLHNVPYEMSQVKNKAYVH